MQQQQYRNENNNSNNNCVIHLRDDTIGDGNSTTLKPVPVTAPMTLHQFRGCNAGLADISSIIECDSTGAPLKRGMMMTQPGDVLQPGRHYIVRRDVVQQQQQQQQDPNGNGGGGKGVTFSSMATVREYSLSFAVSQSPMQTAAGASSISAADLRGGGPSVPPGFGVASLFRHPNTTTSSSDAHQKLQQPSAARAVVKNKFPFSFEYGGTMQECSEHEFRQMMQRDFVGEAQRLGRDLDAALQGENRPRF